MQTPAAGSPFRAFPLELLPGPLANYIDASAAAIGCDPAMVALPTLAACAGAAGNSCVLRLKRTWDEPCVLWLPVVAPSGELKTPAWKAGTGALLALQMDHADQHREKAARWEQLSAAERKERKDEAPGPEKSFVATDTTVQALAVALGEHPRGVLLSVEELDHWFQSFTRFSPNGASDRAQWLTMHGAGVLRVLRKTGEPKIISVRHAAVSIAGTIQPAVFARAAGADAAASGLLARLWPSMPPPLRRRWSEAEPAEGLVSGYRALLGGLLALPYDRSAGPTALRLTAGAKDIWVDFYDRWAARQAGAQAEWEKALLAKLEGGAARFALLHQLVSHVSGCTTPESLQNREVVQSSMAAGVALAGWFAYESLRVYANLAESEEDRQGRELCDWIAQRPAKRCTVRDLCTYNARRYPTATDAEAALQGLVMAGRGSWQHVPPGPRGGQPTRFFQLAVCTTSFSA